MNDASHPLDLSINIVSSERPPLAILFNLIILYKGIILLIRAYQSVKYLLN